MGADVALKRHPDALIAGPPLAVASSSAGSMRRARTMADDRSQPRIVKDEGETRYIYEPQKQANANDASKVPITRIAARELSKFAPIPTKKWQEEQSYMKLR
jgi:hypothetical protein